jgi:release factor glutamine methyltransferase
VTVQEALGGSGLDAREARLLLAEATGFSQAAVLAFPERVLPPAVQDHFLEYIEKRKRGEPIAYIVGRKEFYGIDLTVNPAVLIPRPETELLVDLVLDLLKARPGGVAIDVGTGSGAIALALAAEGVFDRVLAGDVSADAIAVAQANANRLKTHHWAALDFRCGSFLAPFLNERARLVVSNPPYIADSEAPQLPVGVRAWEPAIALFGGPDGMTAIRRIIRDASAVLEPGGWLALEVDSRRASWAVEAVSMYDCYTEISVRLDLTGQERFVLARMRENQ